MSRSRRTNPSLLLRAALVVSLAAVCATPLLAQNQGRRALEARKAQFAVGTESLRWLLKRANLQAVNDPARLESHPEKTILIVLGDLNFLEAKVPGGIANFLDRGGALLAASDKPSGQTLRGCTGAEVRGFTLEYRGHPDQCHRKQFDRPFVIPESENADNPFARLHVATNIPSYLDAREELPAGIELLARLPKGVEEVWPSLPAWLPTDESLPFAVGGTRGSGRVILLADHSVFINEMMLSDECENLDFALECLDWLGAGSRRTRAMLVEDGHIHPNFEVTLREVPPIPPLKVVEELYARRNEILEEMQRRLARAEAHKSADVTALRLLGVRNLSEPGLVFLRRQLLWLLGILLFAGVLYRMSNHGRHLPEKRVPLLATVVASQRPHAAAGQQRPRAQFDAGNLWESARDLVRHRLSRDAGQAPGTPQVVADGWWQRRRVRRRVQWLWNIAYGSYPVRIAPGRWEYFLRELDAFDKDVANGTVLLPAV